jgi:hypothetical protein
MASPSEKRFAGRTATLKVLNRLSNNDQRLSDPLQGFIRLHWRVGGRDLSQKLTRSIDIHDVTPPDPPGIETHSRLRVESLLALPHKPGLGYQLAWLMLEYAGETAIRSRSALCSAGDVRAAACVCRGDSSKVVPPATIATCRGRRPPRRHARWPNQNRQDEVKLSRTCPLFVLAAASKLRA